MSQSGYKMLGASLALAAIAGCAGNGAGLDANGQPIGTGGTGNPAPLTADFQSIQDHVFTPICTRCHSGAGAPQGLQLDADHSYALLVGVASAEVNTLLRVKPGDPDNSYLVLKLQGEQRISGARMPFGGPYLDQATINVIRQWIANGAPKAMSLGEMRPMALGSFYVTATSPLADSVVTFPVARIVIAFNREVDVSLVNDTTVQLEALAAAGSDASMSRDGAAAPLAKSLATAAGNSATLVITPSTPLSPGTYRLTLRGTGGGAIADVDAESLGSDYSFVFTVDNPQ